MALSPATLFRYRDRPISHIANCADKECLMDQHDTPLTTETGQDIPFIAHGSYPRRGGSLFSPLVDSAPAFRLICEAVEHAQHIVWITFTFIATDFQMP